jgi:hypothetical protein
MLSVGCGLTAHKKEIILHEQGWWAPELCPRTLLHKLMSGCARERAFRVARLFALTEGLETTI